MEYDPRNPEPKRVKPGAKTRRQKTNSNPNELEGDPEPLQLHLLQPEALMFEPAELPLERYCNEHIDQSVPLCLQFAIFTTVR